LLSYALAPVVTVPVMIPAATADRHKDASLGYEGNCQEQYRDPQIVHRAHLLTASDEREDMCIPRRSLYASVISSRGSPCDVRRANFVQNSQELLRGLHFQK
jgi:hypothetical protein